MSTQHGFGIDSQFRYHTLKVTLHSINAEAIPPTAILVDQSGEHIEVTLAESWQLYRATHGYSDAGPAHLEPIHQDTGAGLSDRQLKVARERTEHVLEILYGDPSGVVSADSDARFDPARSNLNTRVELKADQLSGIPGYSTSSLHRMIKSYQERGTQGLAPYAKQTNGPARPSDGVDPEILDQIHRSLNALARNKSTVTLGAYMVRASVDLEKAGLDTSTLTHHRFEGIIRDISETLRLRQTARSRRSLQSRSTRGRRRPPPSYPGEQIEIDSTQMNVLVQSPTGGKPLRPWAIVAICVLTRVVFIRLTPEPPTSRDVRLLLWDVYGPIAAGLDLDDNGLPLGMPNAVTIPEQPFRMNVGTVVSDHGREFENTKVIELLRSWGCDIVYARTRTGSDKAYVESVNRTLDLFQQDLQGYVGQGPEHRGDNLGPLFTFKALEAILKTWLLEEYLHRPHSGLPVQGIKGEFYSPAQAFDLAMRRGAALECHLTPDDVYTILDSANVTVHSDGVRCNGLRYDGPSLRTIKSGEVSPLGSLQRKRKVRYDPNDRSRVFFRDDHGRWHVLHAIDRNGYTLPPFSDSIASEVAAAQTRRLPSVEVEVRRRSNFVHVIDTLAQNEPHTLDIDRIRILNTVPDPVGVPSVLEDENDGADIVYPLSLEVEGCLDDPIDEGDLW